MSRGRDTALYLSRYVLFGMALAAFVPALGHAQGLSGQLSGTVVDSSGAVVPDASVVVTDQASKSIRRSKTNSDGNFSFAGLPPANYTVTVETAGFQKWERTGLEFRLGEKRSLNVRLNVAGLSEEVAVTASAAEIAPTNSGEKSATLTSEQIENITIVGRSAAELLKVLPGLSPIGGGSNNRPGFSGEVDRDQRQRRRRQAERHRQLLGQRDHAPTPSTSRSTARPAPTPAATARPPSTRTPSSSRSSRSCSRTSGPSTPRARSPCSVVSKSGGREFHGSVFTYVRDYHLNSNEWFSNKMDKERTKNKFTFPGFTLSGPLLIPGTNFNKNRDKVFFFVGFEYFKQRLDTGLVQARGCPTEEMRNGDFSQAPNLGLGGGSINARPQRLPGRHHPVQPDRSRRPDPAERHSPSERRSPPGQRLQLRGQPGLRPERLAAPRRAWTSTSPTTPSCSCATTASARCSPSPIGLWWRNGERQVPYPLSRSRNNQSDSWTVSLTHVFDPTLTNETILGRHLHQLPEPLRRPVQGLSGARSATPTGGIFDKSNDQIPSYAGGLGRRRTGLLQPGRVRPDPLREEVADLGRGATSPRWRARTPSRSAPTTSGSQNSQPGNGNSNGHIVSAPWGGNSTGNASPTSCSAGSEQYNEASKNVLHNIKYNQIEGYVQDSWKIKPRLTLDGGIRMSLPWPLVRRPGARHGGVRPVEATTRTLPNSALSGIAYNAIDSSIPLTGSNVQGLFFHAARRLRLGREGHRRHRDPRRRRHLPLPRPAVALRRRHRLRLRSPRDQPQPARRRWPRSTSSGPATSASAAALWP